MSMDADQAGQFVQRFNISRYLALIDWIDSKMMPKPKTLAKANEAASAFAVRVRDIKRAAGAYSAEAKPGGKPKPTMKESGQEGMRREVTAGMAELAMHVVEWAT